jgi:hypothetical protein
MQDRSTLPMTGAFYRRIPVATLAVDLEFTDRMIKVSSRKRAEGTFLWGKCVSNHCQPEMAPLLSREPTELSTGVGAKGNVANDIR